METKNLKLLYNLNYKKLTQNNNKNKTNYINLILYSD